MTTTRLLYSVPFSILLLALCPAAHAREPLAKLEDEIIGVWEIDHRRSLIDYCRHREGPPTGPDAPCHDPCEHLEWHLSQEPSETVIDITSYAYSGQPYEIVHRSESCLQLAIDDKYLLAFALDNGLYMTRRSCDDEHVGGGRHFLKLREFR
ncbi:MAG: hypothetical protein AAF515_11255 [Pseudomonadota bacterium]